MSILVVENGTGVPGANAYGATDVLSEALAYHKSRGNKDWLIIGSDYQREQCIVRGFDFMTALYRYTWKGFRATLSQTADWPRVNVYLDDTVAAYSTFPLMYDIHTIPPEVMQAQYELALIASKQDLAPDLDPLTLREKVDVIEIQYDPNASPIKIFRRVGMLVAPFLNGGKSGVVRDLVRA